MAFISLNYTCAYTCCTALLKYYCIEQGYIKVINLKLERTIHSGVNNKEMLGEIRELTKVKIFI